MQPFSLSKADAEVLDQVFDPESGPTKAEVIVDPSLPPDRHILDPAILAKLKAQEKAAIKFIEEFESSVDRRTRTKESAFRSALKILDNIIEQHPTYASARNNRAQLRRWRFGDRNLIFRRRAAEEGELTENFGATVSDLQQAVSLASPQRSQDAVSPRQGKLLAQAYTQLGALHLAASKEVQDGAATLDGDEFEMMDERFVGWTKGSFEEEASRCFFLGGLYGNEVAKALAVHTNPHAKLCGNIVKEALRKELGGVGA